MSATGVEIDELTEIVNGRIDDDPQVAFLVVLLAEKNKVNICVVSKVSLSLLSPLRAPVGSSPVVVDTLSSAPSRLQYPPPFFELRRPT